MLLLPNCKINIGLNVVARRSDGFHNLETAFYPIPLRDALEFKALPHEAEAFRLSLSGVSIPGKAEDNLVVRVYLSLKEEFGLPPLEISLRKNIPTGAGLGGGSSDGAFMMTGLNEAFDLGLSPQEMEHRIARFGADCAFFVRNRPAFASGIGDVLSPASFSLKGKFIVLVKPDVFVSTKDAYSYVVPSKPLRPLSELLAEPIENWRDTVVNDFEQSVFKLHPLLAAIKQTLYDLGAVYAAMSGSGSTIYGIFNRPTPEARKLFAPHFVFLQKLVR